MSANNEESLFLLGSSHRTAPLEIREKIALDPQGKENLYHGLLNERGFDECLILNTCNRTEIYSVCEKPNARQELEELFCDHHKIQKKVFKKYAFWKQNEEVIKHVFEVAAGLDSQMVGETEILGQVKSSFSEATEKKVVGPVLNRVFQKSFQAAKWARTNTGIGRGQVSIGNVATELAIRVCGDLDTSSILTIGSGEVGEKTTQALVSRGAKQITIANRNLIKARELADTFRGAVIPLKEVPFILQHFDIVISCTASPDPLLTMKDIEPAMQSRATRPLFIIDLAVPRDVDANATKINNVYLYNVDHLAKIANENLKARMAEMEVCRHALFDKAGHVWAALQKRKEMIKNGAIESK